MTPFAWLRRRAPSTRGGGAGADPEPQRGAALLGQRRPEHPHVARGRRRVHARDGGPPRVPAGSGLSVCPPPPPPFTAPPHCPRLGLRSPRSLLPLFPTACQARAACACSSCAIPLRHFSVPFPCVTSLRHFPAPFRHFLAPFPRITLLHHLAASPFPRITRPLPAPLAGTAATSTAEAPTARFGRGAPPTAAARGCWKGTLAGCRCWPAPGPELSGQG